MTTIARSAAYRWPNCYRLANSQIELIVTADVGPRIIHFGFVGGENEFGVFPEQLGLTGDGEWHSYGGHRFWHAPEAIPRTYYPDNVPVQVIEQPEGLRVVQPIEPSTAIQKEIDLWMAPDEAHVRVTHRLRNRSPWALEMAPWALTVMAPGGVAIVPLPPRGPHSPQYMLPTSTLTFWPYTDPADPRFIWGSKYVMLRQDPALPVARKLGASVPDGWTAYARGGHLFVKRFRYDSRAVYPDFGCCVEIFTNAEILELETLGPLARLAPGESAEHVEDWYLYAGVPVPANDADVETQALPLVYGIYTART
jgi:hypothetical protein